jgi:DNA-binding MarR family transcriptional regulator
MSTKQEKYKETQLNILKHLFKLGTPARIEELCGIAQSSKSETEYHCDQLVEKGWIHSTRVPKGMTRQGEGDVWGWEISSSGKKHIMESES